MDEQFKVQRHSGGVSPLVIILLVIIILLVGVVGYLVYRMPTKVKDMLGVSPTATVSTTAVPKLTSPTATQTTDPGLEASKEAATNFLNAKKTRSLSKAKPYMTDSYYASTSQEVFAGVSSPSMGRFEIKDAETLKAGEKYNVKARVYQNLNGQEVGYSDNTLEIVKVGDKYLVNKYTEGDFTETQRP